MDGVKYELKADYNRVEVATQESDEPIVIGGKDGKKSYVTTSASEIEVLDAHPALKRVGSQYPQPSPQLGPHDEETEEVEAAAEEEAKE